MATIKLEVVSPDKVVYSDDIAMLIVRSTGGELGILPHHAPLVTGLIPFPMRVMFADDRPETFLAVAGGFMEVTPEKITVLASAAEVAEEIDIERAKESLARAKERIAAAKGGDADVDMTRAEAALQRAICRLRTAKVEFEA